jgi:hypothetical protein
MPEFSGVSGRVNEKSGDLPGKVAMSCRVIKCRKMPVFVLRSALRALKNTYHGRLARLARGFRMYLFSRVPEGMYACPQGSAVGSTDVDGPAFW